MRTKCQRLQASIWLLSICLLLPPWHAHADTAEESRTVVVVSSDESALFIDHEALAQSLEAEGYQLKMHTGPGWGMRDTSRETVRGASAYRPLVVVVLLNPRMDFSSAYSRKSAGAWWWRKQNSWERPEVVAERSTNLKQTCLLLDAELVVAVVVHTPGPPSERRLAYLKIVEERTGVPPQVIQFEDNLARPLAEIILPGAREAAARRLTGDGPSIPFAALRRYLTLSEDQALALGRALRNAQDRRPNSEDTTNRSPIPEDALNMVQHIASNLLTEAQWDRWEKISTSALARIESSKFNPTEYLDDLSEPAELPQDLDQHGLPELSTP